MSTYGKINHNDFELVQTEFNKTKILDSSSLGVSRIQALSSSLKTSSGVNTPTTASNHYYSIRTLFYSSSYNQNEDMNEQRYPIIPINPKRKMHTNKFEDSASIFYIPQKYFGEKIKEGSFKLTDNHHPSSSIILQDDGKGNLYAPSAYEFIGTKPLTISSSLSSSVNYIGNIMYDMGVVIITDTGSFSGSAAGHGMMYQDVGSGPYEIKFESTQNFYIRQWTVKITPDTYMHTMNPTARRIITDSDGNPSATSGGTKHIYSPYILSTLTGSNWAPYVSSIQLYGDTDLKTVMGEQGQTELKVAEPLVIANLPRAIQMRDDMTIIFKIKLDY
jgi:hypothetical protein